MTENANVFNQKVDIAERLVRLLGIDEKTYLSRDSISDFFNPDLYLSNNTRKTSVKKKNLTRIMSDTTNGLENILENNAFVQKSREIFESINYSVKSSGNALTKSAKKIYSTFVNYSKKAYEVLKTKVKKFVGNVRYTISKFANISLFCKSALNPQWNFAPGSALDKDTPSNAITSHTSIDSEDVRRYSVGGEYLSYHH